MTTRQGGLGRTAAHALLGLAAAMALISALLSAPIGKATPESDAQDAITATWEAAGGESSPLGSPHGDVYPVGAGFARDFAGGKVFFTPETGARAMYGAILDKYDSWGGPADSDLGFPNSNEVAGLVSPDSRMVTFSAPDHPLIFWTPEHGAYVVRGAMNVAWDKLGSSTGALGVPVADETQDGAVISQKFSGGSLSWNSQTKVFSSEPPELASQLGDLKVDVDPTVAINRAWHAAGGLEGPLGAKQGDQFQVGNDGVGQGYAGGKVYYGPATGAAAVENDILAKYESLGGPTGSDLGFPIANEADGGIPNSRIVTFSGADNPVIFYTPENGAFVVRGAMKIAWDKLDGAAGKLGAPVGDQTVEGDVVSQKFTGGSVSWNRVSNTFGTDPAELAASLSGLQIPGSASNPSSAASGQHGLNLPWHWWWLGVAAGVLVLVGGLVALLRWRRKPARPTVVPRKARVVLVAPEGGHEDAGLDEQWAPQHDEPDTTVRIPSRYGEAPGGPPSGVDLLGGPPSGVDLLGGRPGWSNYTEPEVDEADENEPATEPTRIPSETGRHAASDDAGPRTVRPEPPTDHVLFRPHAERYQPLVEGARDDQHQPWEARRPEPARPAMHLPLDDPYRAPEGYPVKANFSSGLYYTVESALYDDTLAEVWFVSEEAAQNNGFVRAR